MDPYSGWDDRKTIQTLRERERERDGQKLDNDKKRY
jgi:hypothetical protein